jgi:hypothetical protein
VHNNLIYVTDHGLVDAMEITDEAWTSLILRNTQSTKRQLVKCAWCWDERRATRWMRTYDMTGIRTISHQPGEGDNHPYRSIETPQHRAYNQRVARVGDSEGHVVTLEDRAADGATRADVLLRGKLEVAYEHQHSPFKKGRGALERSRLAVAAGRDFVLWHTDKRAIARSSRAPMLRSDDLPTELIDNPNYQIRMVSGFRAITLWNCTAREGHRCPRGRMTGCGRDHFGTEPRALTLDAMARQAPAGLILPVRLDGHSPGHFMTDLASLRRYEEHFGAPADPLLRRPVGPRGPQRRGRGQGHSLPATEAAPGNPIPPCHICKAPASLPNEQGQPEHYSCRK